MIFIVKMKTNHVRLVYTYNSYIVLSGHSKWTYNAVISGVRTFHLYLQEKEIVRLS